MCRQNSFAKCINNEQLMQFERHGVVCEQNYLDTQYAGLLYVTKNSKQSLRRLGYAYGPRYFPTV